MKTNKFYSTTSNTKVTPIDSKLNQSMQIINHNIAKFCFLDPITLIFNTTSSTKLLRLCWLSPLWPIVRNHPLHVLLVNIPFVKKAQPWHYI